MNTSQIMFACAAVLVTTGSGASLAEDYDCGTEQAAIRKRTHEIKADADARKVNAQNRCAYQLELADLAERQAAFVLNCYRELKLTEQQAEAKALLLGLSGKNMRAQCSHTK